MGGSKNISFPSASTEERQLQSEQTALLAQQRDFLSAQQKEQQLLAPVLYKQLGITPTYDGEGNLTGYETYTTPDAQKQADLQSQSLDLQKQLLDLSKQEATRAGDPALAARRAELEDLQLQAARKALEPVAADPNADVKAANEKMLAERSWAALNGQLPVNPALTKQLADEEQALHESFRAQLGPGYETSSPFLEAMDKFQLRKTSILESSRRDDLSLSESLGLARDQSANQRLALTSGLTSGTAQDALSRIGVGASTSSGLGGAYQQNLNSFLGGAAGVSGLGQATLSQFNGAVQGGNNLLGYYLGQRQGGFQANQANVQGQTQRLGQYLNLYNSTISAAGNALSSAKFKKGITPLDPDEYRGALKRLVDTPVTRWRYHWESDDREPHIGPILELSPKEIQAGDGNHVSLLDYLGLVHASVKGLDREVKTLRKAMGRG